jgi:4-methyl-5(b-hydroxyethyl)-thiazole monophosphate biosynthesis
MVYILLAEGFEEMEALVPADLLRRAGIQVALVGLNAPVVTGSHGIAVTADLLLEQADAEEMDMLVLPGGLGGVESMQMDLFALAFIQKTYTLGRWLCAICAAPTLLAHLGLLDRRKAVCYPGMEDEMDSAVVLPDQEVVVNGRIITARAAGSAYEFGFQLITALVGAAKAEEVRHGIHYRDGENRSAR